MSLKHLMPWRRSGLRRHEGETRPFPAFRRDMLALQDEMDRLYEEFWHNGGRSNLLAEFRGDGDLMPEIDQSEDDEAYHIKAELPGLDEKDVELTLADGVLTIRGEKKQDEEEKGKDFYRRERSFGSFSRTLPLGNDVDEEKIEASFDKGVLRIDVPKSEQAKKNVKRIEVSSSA